MSIKAFLLIGAAFATISLASGCGGDSASSEEITVHTGSLSKAKFIERADAICTTARSQFLREFSAFGRQHKPPTSSKSDQVAWLGELVDTVLVPNYEKPIDGISALGAPKGDEQEIASLLNSLRQRLDEIGEQPAELTGNPLPFSRTAKLASAYGLTGCAESFG